MKRKLVYGTPLALLALGIVLIFLGFFLSGRNSSPEELKTPGVINGTVLSRDQDEEHMIYGFVKQEGNGRGLSGAIVRTAATINDDLISVMTKSQPDGAYELIVPVAGEYVVAAEIGGFHKSTIEGVQVNSRVAQDIIMTATGHAGPPPPAGDPEGYVVIGGVDEAGARTLLAVNGFLDNAEIVSFSETNLTGKFDADYRDGQAIPRTRIVFNNEPVWEIHLSDGKTVHIQKKCGNFISKVTEVVVVVAATPVPTGIVWTATPTPTSTPVPAVCTPTPTCISRATSTPIPTSTPTFTSTPTNTPTNTPTKTSTPVPTATNTAVPPTFTPTRTPTFTATPTATPIPPTLEGRAWAEPDSGYAPLLGVDVFIEITGGTATGPIDYYVDCTLDGSWDIQIPGANNTSQHIVDICSFPTPGEYHILTLAKREGIPLSSLLTIEVFTP